MIINLMSVKQTVSNVDISEVHQIIKLPHDLKNSFVEVAERWFHMFWSNSQALPERHFELKHLLADARAIEARKTTM